MDSKLSLHAYVENWVYSRKILRKVNDYKVECNGLTVEAQNSVK